MTKLSLFLLLLPLPPPAQAAEKPGDKPSDGMTVEKLGDCLWKVSYRGRIYDLSPLMRESLSRPLDNDLRYVLERVPQSNERLNALNESLHSAKTYTILASVFITAAIVTKILEGRLQSDHARPTYRIIEGSTGALFLTSAILSWRSTSHAKQELVNAVDEFNARSPYKIEPASGRALEPSRDAAPTEPTEH